MRTFVVGDIQGCYQSLCKLLEKIEFDASSDQLWAVGDLVNRGPESLEVLRYCRSLGKSFRTVLGNHDLHLLAIARGHTSPRKNDTLDKILAAPDRDELLEWLQSQPLVHIDSEQQVALVHAGIPPQWNLQDAQTYANEVSAVLQSNDAELFFRNMYGNEPDLWDDRHSGPDRWRLITNYLTRMRFCSPEGRLELTQKDSPDSAPEGFYPWYSLRHPKQNEPAILFGHWASLEGSVNTSKLQALDTGCVWGGSLTALELGKNCKRISVTPAEGKRT